MSSFQDHVLFIESKRSSTPNPLFPHFYKFPEWHLSSSLFSWDFQSRILSLLPLQPLLTSRNHFCHTEPSPSSTTRQNLILISVYINQFSRPFSWHYLILLLHFRDWCFSCYFTNRSLNQFDRFYSLPLFHTLQYLSYFCPSYISSDRQCCKWLKRVTFSLVVSPHFYRYTNIFYTFQLFFRHRFFMIRLRLFFLTFIIILSLWI